MCAAPGVGRNNSRSCSDTICAHAEESCLYESLKYQLAARRKEDRHGHTDAKAPFIWEIMANADRWGQEVGWEPSPSDA